MLPVVMLGVAAAVKLAVSVWLLAALRGAGSAAAPPATPSGDPIAVG